MKKTCTKQAESSHNKKSAGALLSRGKHWRNGNKCPAFWTLLTVRSDFERLGAGARHLRFFILSYLVRKAQAPISLLTMNLLHAP